MSGINPYVKQQRADEERKYQAILRIGNFLEELVALKVEELKLLKEKL